MSFNTTSNSIWQEMRTGTGSAHVPDTGDYEVSFYGGAGEGIDFQSLAIFLKKQQNDASLIYYRPDYERGGGSEPGIFTGPGMGSAPIVTTYNTPFTYKNDLGKSVQALLSGSLNKRTDYIDSTWGFRISIDPVKEELSATLRIYYANTEDYRKPAKDTTDANDFRIEEKYVAMSLTTTNLTDFCYLIKELYGETNFTFMQDYISQQIANQIWFRKEGSSLNYLYENIPEFAFSLIPPKVKYETLEEHLGILKSYDDTGFFSWFKDSSGAVISLFRLMCNGDCTKLFNTLKANPTLTREIYYNLDGTSTIDGQTETNYVLYANLLNMICMVKGYEGLTDTGYTFYIGKQFEVDSNVLASNDDVTNKIFLRQFKKKTVYYSTPYDMDEFGVGTGGDSQVEQSIPVDAGANYFPLDLVTLIDMDSQDRTPYKVPAIFVKAIADKEEWKDIKKNIRIGLDVLAIIIGVASLGTASPLAFALASTDIALSATDIMVAINEDELMKTPEGREFLANWDKIMVVGAIVTAGPLLLRSTFSLGAKLFSKATLLETKNFLRASLIKIVLEVNIANFAGKTIRIIETVQEIVVQSKSLLRSAQVIELQKVGVIFVQGDLKVMKGFERLDFALIYEGELIIGGEAKMSKSLLKRIKNLKGEELKQVLTDIKAEVGADPVKLLWGSGKSSHPKLWKKILADISDQGVKVKYGEKNLAYGPHPSGGAAGTITITEDASITALLHEAQHFYDDAALGFPGWEHTVYNAVTRWNMEYKAYMKEIEFLRNNKEFDVAKKVLDNAEKEKKALEAYFDTKL